MFNVERAKILAKEDRSFNLLVHEAFIYAMEYNFIVGHKESECLKEYELLK